MDVLAIGDLDMEVVSVGNISVSDAPNDLNEKTEKALKVLDCICVDLENCGPPVANWANLTLSVYLGIHT